VYCRDLEGVTEERGKYEKVGLLTSIAMISDIGHAVVSSKDVGCLVVLEKITEELFRLLHNRIYDLYVSHVFLVTSSTAIRCRYSGEHTFE
jgi:hypothetical protein